MSASAHGDASSIETEKERDGRLLRRYVEQGAQSAFDALVRRHLSFVYATCLREVSDADLAQDVTLAVFYVLSRKAHTLRSGAVLTSWLFQTARLASRNALRKERTRMRHERRGIQEAAMREAESQSDSELRERIEPYLNSALAALRPPERDVLLLRYFDGLSEDAVRMRISRALEKMRRHLAKAGVALSVAMLTSFLAEHASGATAHPALLSLLIAGHACINPALSVVPRRSLQISKGALRAMSVMFSYSPALTALAFVGLLGAVGLIQTKNLVNANRVDALRQQIEKTAQGTDSLAANWTTSYTLDGATHLYGGFVQLKRPNLFRLEVGPPYNNTYVSNGQEVHTLKASGTDRMEDKTEAMQQGQIPVQLMDLPLAYLFMTADLKGFGRLLFQEAPQMMDGGTEKRDGVTYRLLELHGSKDRHLVRLYILPNRIVAGMYTELETLSMEESPDGNRITKKSWMTGMTFLRDMHMGKPISDTAFVFQAKPDNLQEKQPATLTVGEQAPDFEVTNPMDSAHVSLSGLLQGKSAVLVNFWFSGCPPCREEFPHLQRLYTEFKDRGFDMIALNGNVADDSKLIRTFFSKNHYSFRPGIAHHIQLRPTLDDIAWQYGVRAYPTNFLIGSNGKILWSGIGYDERGLRDALAQVGLR